MNETDETVTFARFAGPDEHGRGWAADEAAVDTSAASTVPGLVSLSFLAAAIRRRAGFWCLLGVIGLLLGTAVYLKVPPSYKATTTLFIAYNNNDNNGDGGADAIATDQSLFQSVSVAALTVRSLHLNETPAAFLARYTVTAVTDQVLQITMNAPSPADALRWANALDQQSLAFRAAMLNSQNSLTNVTLNSQVTKAKAKVSALDSQISKLAGQPTSPTVKSQLSHLRSERNADTTKLGALEQNVQSTETSNQVDNIANIQGARVLDKAALAHRSKLRLMAEYVGSGLLLGLVLGMAIVIVQALVSDKLRRRFDVAQALAAPVRLSIGRVRSRYAPARGARQPGSRSRGIRLVVRHLRDVRASVPQPAALAVVPADDAGVAAVSLVNLALSYAQKGLTVVLADLTDQAGAARLLRVSEPGLHVVQTDGADLSLFVADPADVAPVGPLATRDPADPEAPATDLVAAYNSADRLLTLAPLDPAVGGDHLATWASAAVVIVTAGRSSAVKLRATADMIRLSGTYLASAVLIGADKTDESLGTAEPPGSAATAEAELLRLGSS